MKMKSTIELFSEQVELKRQIWETSSMGDRSAKKLFLGLKEQDELRRLMASALPRDFYHARPPKFEDLTGIEFRGLIVYPIAGELSYCEVLP